MDSQNQVHQQNFLFNQNMELGERTPPPQEVRKLERTYFRSVSWILQKDHLSAVRMRSPLPPLPQQASQTVPRFVIQWKNIYFLNVFLELDNIKFRNVEMKSSTFFTSLLNLFATYIYYGIEGNEQGFCDEVISRMQKHSPKLIWTCCVGTFNATQRFHEAFMQLDNFFGKSFIVYDYHLGNCCEPPEETIAERLLEIAVLHEKDEDSVQNIRKALEDVFDGRYWNCAICNSDATFFYATSDLSKLQIFHAELSNGNFVKAWLLVK